MADSGISEEFKKMASLYKFIADIKDETGRTPGKVLLGYPLSVSNPVIVSGTQYRPVFNSGRDINIFFLGSAIEYKPTFNLDALSGDALRAGKYAPVDDAGQLDALLAKYKTDFVSRTYNNGQFEFLSQKDVDARASELVEKPIVPATLAAAAPIEVVTREPINMPKFEPHKIDEGLVLRFGVFEPRAEALTFEGAVGAVRKMADVARNAGNFDRAMQYYYQYLQQIPTSSPVWSIIFEVAKTKPKVVVEWLNRTKDFAPIEPDIWLMKGQAAEIAGASGLTFDFFYKALQKRTSLNVWGNLQGAMSKIARKDDLFERLEEIEPESHELWKKRAQLAGGVGEKRRAIQYNTRAFQLSPQDAATLAELKRLLKDY